MFQALLLDLGAHGGGLGLQGLVPVLEILDQTIGVKDLAFELGQFRPQKQPAQQAPGQKGRGHICVQHVYSSCVE